MCHVDSLIIMPTPPYKHITFFTEKIESSVLFPSGLPAGGGRGRGGKVVVGQGFFFSGPHGTRATTTKI